MESQMYTFEAAGIFDLGVLRKRKPGRKPKSLTDALNPRPMTPEDKKLERMQRNREAADLSRRRRRERLNILEVFAQRLCQENDMLKRRAVELARLRNTPYPVTAVPVQGLPYFM